MYIISKFSDYYDSVSSLGIDKTHVFERHTEELETNIKVSDKRLKLRFKDRSYKEVATKEQPDIDFFVIGFCGKIYIGWKLSWEERENYEIVSRKIEKITYDKNIIVDIIGKDKANELNDFYDSIENNKNFQLFTKYHVPYFKAYLNLRNKYFNYYNGTFIENLILLPNLKEHEFYRMFDTFSAFQEIDMFLFGVLGTKEKDLSEVPEEYRLTARGMDKTSFRQMAPGHKKEKRRENKLRKRKKNKL